MALRIRVKKQDGVVIRKPYDIERLREFIGKVPDGKNILISYKIVPEEGTDDELRAQHRKYYFSQIANPVADEMGDSGLVFHATMKYHFATKPHPTLDGMTMIRSVFSDHSDMEADERIEFIKRVKALVWSLYPEFAIPNFEL